VVDDKNAYIHPGNKVLLLVETLHCFRKRYIDMDGS